MGAPGAPSSGEARDWVPLRPGLVRYPGADGEPPALLGSRCRPCGRVFFPARAVCPACFSPEGMEEKPLHPHGVVHACTVVHVPSPVGIAPPYACGYVDIPAEGVRVFALLTGAEPAAFAPGQAVEAVVGPIRRAPDGRAVIAYTFRPRAER